MMIRTKSEGQMQSNMYCSDLLPCNVLLHISTVYTDTNIFLISQKASSILAELSVGLYLHLRGTTMK